MTAGFNPDVAFAVAPLIGGAAVLSAVIAAGLIRLTRFIWRSPMSAYAKALAAIVATVLSGIVAALTGDAVIDPGEWINIAILAVGAAGVFAAPNVPGARYTKSVLAVLTAVLTLSVSLIAGGLDLTEWLQLGVAALGALGVYAVPNQGEYRLAA